MRTKSSSHRPYPRVIGTETGGIGVQPMTRPQLTSRWALGEDGKLSCQWNSRI